MAKKLLRNSLGEIIRTPSGSLMYDEDGASCCCPLYCDDCCTGDFDGYEITISGSTDSSDYDCPGLCEGLNDTFCIYKSSASAAWECHGERVYGGGFNCVTYINWRIVAKTGGKCDLVVRVFDSSVNTSAHVAMGELELDAGDPCQDVTGAMTMTITPPATSSSGSPMPTVCDLSAVQVTVDGICSS